MSSLRGFITSVECRDTGSFHVLLQTSLTTDASRPNAGWVTKLTFTLSPRADAAIVIRVERVTTLVSRTSRGLRRVLKYSPQTTDRLTIRAGQATHTTRTRWDDEWTAAAPTTSAPDFEQGDLLALLRGVIETNEGRPLVDWLAENGGEVAPYLTAGWLPTRKTEFWEMKQKRDEEFGTSDEDECEYDTTDDRWR